MLLGGKTWSPDALTPLEHGAATVNTNVKNVRFHGFSTTV